jgi:phosphatidylserine/phosphatidylglycerophosphate/cardiolipin synthase-like enzyme
MIRLRQVLAEQARRLAAEVPPALVEMLADSVERSTGPADPCLLGAPDRAEGQGVQAALRSLGPVVGARSEVYLWPRDRRQSDDAGNRGVLHVKTAVADARLLFLSSANLTEHAFTLNMELGLLLSGGPLPGQVEAQFDELIRQGVLAQVRQHGS